MHQIFYVTLDPERALGVEDLLLSYHILHSEESQLTDPVSSFGVDIKRFLNKDGSKLFNTAKFLEDTILQKYIEKNTVGQPDILVFKNDEKTVEICKSLGYNLLNPTPQLGKELEGNKVEFSKFISGLNIFDAPKFIEFTKLSEVNYLEIAKELGDDFVIQFLSGFSGNGTFFINNEIELKKIQSEYPLRQGKAVKKIKGPAYTINACITKLGVIIGGISEQITGIKTLTSSDGGTVGNDFTQRHLDDTLRSELIQKTMNFGEVLKTKNHRGIFGLDLVLDLEEKKFYLIEANIRQVLSSGFTSYLQRVQHIVPIMLWHILELIDHNFDERFNSLDAEAEEWINNEIQKLKTTDLLQYNIQNNLPINASQIFFRNIQPYNVRILEQFPSGIYRMRGRNPQESASMEDAEEKYPIVFKMREDGWSTLCFIKRGYNILQAEEENGFLINSAAEDSVIHKLGEIGRIQVMQSAFSSEEGNELNGWITDVIDTIYENMRIARTE